MDSAKKTSFQEINYEDRQILSKEAIRSLLNQAVTADKAKTQIIFNVKEIQDAKEYYPFWRKERTFFKRFGFTAVVAGIFGYLLYTNFFGFWGNIGVVVSYLFGLWILSDNATKCRYIEETLGDISFIDAKKRAFFKQGLKSELWGCYGECRFNWVKFAIAGLILIAVTVGEYLAPTFELHKQLSIVGVFAIFIANMLDYFKE